MTAPDNGAPEGGQQDDDFDADAAAQQALADAAREASDSDGDDEDDHDSWDSDRAKREISKRNKENQRLREQLKALKPLADEYEKSRKAGQSEAQKLAEEKSRLEVQLAELTTQNTRREAAEVAGLSPSFVKFISAAEPDEALAQAKELAKALKAATGEDRKPDLRQGARGSNSTGTSVNHDDLLRQMARQQR